MPVNLSLLYIIKLLHVKNILLFAEYLLLSNRIQEFYKPAAKVRIATQPKTLTRLNKRLCVNYTAYAIGLQYKNATSIISTSIIRSGIFLTKKRVPKHPFFRF